MTFALSTEEVRGAFILAADALNADRDNGEDFDAWLAQYTAEVRAAALAEQGETEWEYGRRHVDEGGSPHVRPASDYQGDTESPDGHRADGSPYWNYTRVRRRKAGPWMPVEGEAG